MARAGKRRYNFMGGSSSSSLSKEASSFICGPLWSLSLSLDRSVSLLVGRRWKASQHTTDRKGRGEQNGDLTRVVCRSFGFLLPPRTRFAREEKILTSIASMLKKEGRKKRWLKEERPFFSFLPSTLFSPLFTTCQKCQKSANTFKDCLEYTPREM